MSTRGFITFVIDGAEKTAYNHSDSYPSGLGLDILRWLRAAKDTAATWDAAAELRVVQPNSDPTDEDIVRLKPWTNLYVGGPSERPTWYQLLRGTQGSPAEILKAGYLEDASRFPLDSVFAEYGYVIDLDRQQFEAYRGFQKEAHSRGRFATPDADDHGYYPVALVASWPFDELPVRDDDFCDAIDGDES